MIRILECSIERVEHADNMADAYFSASYSENSECEEIITNVGGERRFHLNHMLDVYENDSETNEFEGNGAGEGRGCLPSQSDCDDLRRPSRLNTIR